MIRSHLFPFGLIALVFLVQVTSQGIKVPLKKVEKPLMAPRKEMPHITDKVYLEISVDDVPIGKIVLGLFGKTAPRTVENFKRLCACDVGKGKSSGVDLCYRNTIIHRISKFCSTKWYHPRQLAISGTQPHSQFSHAISTQFCNSRR